MRLLTSIRAVPVGALALVAASGLGGCISTATYGTGQAPETTLLHEATGGVFKKLDGEQEAAIDYEPRAALVIPPAAQLPEPSPAPNQLAGGNWPTDHDQPGAEERQVLAESEQTRAMTPEYTRRMQTLGGIMGSRKTQQGQIATRQRRLQERDAAKAFLAQRDKGREAFATALAEAEGLNRTERRYLTDPPSQYREPAPTAPSQFEDIEKKGGFFSRLFGG